MLYSLSNIEKAAIGGVRALLVAAFSADALYTYATAERHTITSISGITGGWQRIGVSDQAQWAAPGTETKNGWQHAQKVDLSAPGLSVARRAVLEALKTGPVLALVQDYAGQWWLLGQQLGLKLPGYGLSSGQYRAESATSFSLERLEPEAPRRVAASFLNLIYNSSTQFAEAPTV